MREATAQPLFTRRLLLVLAGMAFAEAARTMTMVQVPLFLRELGADIRQIGLFFTISLIFPLLLRIIGGWVSDSIGRLRAMLIGALSGLAAYAAYAIAPIWQLALAGPAFIALTTALIFPSYKAFIADETPPDQRGRAFGIAETVITTAWILGPPLGGWIAQNFGYRPMFTAAVGAYLIASLVFWGVMRADPGTVQVGGERPNLDSLRASLRQMLVLMVSGGLVTWLLITDGVRDVAFKLSFDLMPIYLAEIGGLSRQSIGLLDGIFGLALAAASFPAGWLIDRTSERTGVTLGLLAVVLSRLVFALAVSFTGFAGSWILLGIGGGLLDPAYSALVARGVPLRLRGITYGLLATSLGLISLPSPWIGSQIWALFGPKWPFLVTAAAGALAIIPAWGKLVAPREVESTSAAKDGDAET